MRKPYLLLISAMLLLTAASFVCAKEVIEADDQTFISLTRRPDAVSKLPVNISVLTSQDIKKMGVTNLPDALRFLPGVKIEGGGSAGAFSKIKIRGVPTSNDVQILIDDQPLGGTSVQNIDASLIPLDDVERIEVVRGGAGLYGANTVGGVIHIITKKGTHDRAGSIAYEAQSFKTNIHTEQVEAKQGGADVIATFRKMDSDGYQNDSQVDQAYASAKVGYTFGNASRISADYSNLKQNQGLTSGTPVSFEKWDGHKEKASNGANSTIDKDSNRARAKIEIPFAFGKFENTGGYSKDERLTNTPFFLSQSKDEIWSNDTRMIFVNGFTAGFSYERDQRNALAQLPHHVTNLAGYLEQELKAGKFLFIPAIRAEHHSLFGSEYNPKLSLVFKPSDAWKFSSNAARTVRAPTITDLYEDFPDTFGDPVNDFHHNAKLKPEIAWTYDFGFEVRPVESFVFNATGFYSHIKDRVTAIDSDGLLNSFGSLTDDTLANTSKAEIAGAEMGAHLKTGPLSHTASYTYQRAKGTSPTSTEFVDIQLTPRHVLGYMLNADLTHGISLLNSVQYVSRQYERDNRRGTVLHPHAVWNAKLEKQWFAFSAFVGVDNITNRLYGESVTFSNPVPQPTRTFKIGAKMTFGQ